MPHKLPLSIGCASLFLCMLAGCGGSDAPASTGASGNGPTKEIVEKVLKASYEQAASSLNPKSTLTLNSVKFGKAYKATAQEVQVDGVPDGATVTPAIVDFTVRTYYDGATQALKRVREANVYVDKMGEWTVVTGSPKGEDVQTSEPVAK